LRGRSKPLSNLQRVRGAGTWQLTLAEIHPGVSG